MSSLRTPRLALLLGLALVAFLGGDGLHGLLHHEAPELAQGPAGFHGEDCDDCAERHAIRDDAHCLLCSTSRLAELDRPASGVHNPDVDTTARDRVARTPDAAPRSPASAPLGARAPPSTT